jgi:hypothetical protein
MDDIITMHCGPVRYEIAAEATFPLYVMVHRIGRRGRTRWLYRFTGGRLSMVESAVSDDRVGSGRTAPWDQLVQPPLE